jgi:hypothetical protein
MNLHIVNTYKYITKVSTLVLIPPKAVCLHAYLQPVCIIPSAYRVIFFNFALWRVESKLSPLGTSATEWPIVPAPGDYVEGVYGGIKIGRGNRSTRRKPAPAPLCPPQIQLDQTRARTRAAAVGSQRLTA